MGGGSCHGALLAQCNRTALLAHELVAAAAEGKDPAIIEDVRHRWRSAGGSDEAPRSGTSPDAGPPHLQALAGDLLDELDRTPAAAAFTRAEPTELVDIEATWTTHPPRWPVPEDRALRGRIHGGWLGPAAGCLLGKPVEEIPREGIREILQATDRWPLDAWFTAKDLPVDVAARWPWNRRSAATSLAENIDGMPEDDDLNFAMLALQLLEEHDDGLTTEAVADAWLARLPAGRVFTTERAAYRNLLLGLTSPQTATTHNPFREWIGAAIRTDVYGWAHPGDPAGAARLAWVDARLSHTGAGVHAAMLVAAMCATAVVSREVNEVLEAGLSVIPPHSRYANAVRRGAGLGWSTTSTENAFGVLHTEFGHLHWVHALNNGALMGFALARSNGDFSTGVCTAVMGGWDTDSVGATVGSVCGALTGAPGLPGRWTEPLRNRVASSLPGFDGVAIDSLTDRTMAVRR